MRETLKPQAQMREALKILGDGACERDVRYAISFAGRVKNWKQSGQYGTLTKPQKHAAEQLSTALHRLIMALRNDHLAVDVKPDTWSFDDSIHDLDRIGGWLEHWRKRVDEVARRQLAPAGPSKAEKLEAAKAAVKLFEAQGIPLHVTRGGKLCQLAAVFSGDKRADLYHYISAVMKDRNRS